ncbi:unnamed protein product [Sphenostylis stenocarpa]|uniref:Uncharacterized protein n=1 Tax=Sphenostylis stenocarpa TaxID=92480 RepID=A0AA86SIW2_9FABA|nr:unnamed protein product [Sphenostylis stenocarpa]
MRSTSGLKSNLLQLKGEISVLFWTCKMPQFIRLLRNYFVNARQLDFAEAFTIFHPRRQLSTWLRGLRSRETSNVVRSSRYCCFVCLKGGRHKHRDGGGDLSATREGDKIWLIREWSDQAFDEVV